MRKAQEKILDGTNTKMVRIWCWGSHGRIRAATIAYMGSSRSYRARSGAGDQNWDTVLVILNNWRIIFDLIAWELEAKQGETNRGRLRQSSLSMVLRDVGIDTKEELQTIMRDWGT